MVAVFVPALAQPVSGGQALLVAIALLALMAAVSWAWKRPLLQRTSIASGASALLFFLMLWADYPFWPWPF